jgi:hypothetical protein
VLLRCLGEGYPFPQDEPSFYLFRILIRRAGYWNKVELTNKKVEPYNVLREKMLYFNFLDEMPIDIEGK